MKQLSSNLLFASIVLVAADVRRLADVFVFNRANIPANLSFDFRRPWISKARRILKPLIIVLATLGPLTASAIVHRNIMKVPPLFGLYEVDEFTRNGVALRRVDAEKVFPLLRRR